MRQMLFSAAFCFILFSDSFRTPGTLSGSGKAFLGLRGQEVKTSPFHGGNTGSIPVGVTSQQSL